MYTSHLLQHGIDFAIYERDDEDVYRNHQRDWSMSLHWGTNYLEQTIPSQLFARVNEIKADPHDQPGPGERAPRGQTDPRAERHPGGDQHRGEPRSGEHLQHLRPHRHALPGPREAARHPGRLPAHLRSGGAAVHPRQGRGAYRVNLPRHGGVSGRRGSPPSR